MKLFGNMLRQVAGESGETVAMSFMCPGCGHLHMVYVRPMVGGPERPVWGFNWLPDAPSFSPSILYTSHRWTPEVTPQNLHQWRAAPWHQEKVAHVCHSFVTDGRIQFLDDCTHYLKGQTVALPSLEKSC